MYLKELWKSPRKKAHCAGYKAVINSRSNCSGTALPGPSWSPACLIWARLLMIPGPSRDIGIYSGFGTKL
ncbi:hypothetical protein SRHO_G00036610 [Serrasalmus rhombeus]